MNAAFAATRPRLLCVDDDPNIVEGLALQLRKRFVVSASTEPREVLASIESGAAKYDVIVSDLRMPAMTGIELLREVRQLAPTTARILLTGYGDFASAIAAVNEAAVHRFLTKPCRADQPARDRDRRGAGGRRRRGSGGRREARQACDARDDGGQHRPRGRKPRLRARGLARARPGTRRPRRGRARSTRAWRPRRSRA